MARRCSDACLYATTSACPGYCRSISLDAPESRAKYETNSAGRPEPSQPALQPSSYGGPVLQLLPLQPHLAHQRRRPSDPRTIKQRTRSRSSFIYLRLTFHIRSGDKETYNYLTTLLPYSHYASLLQHQRNTLLAELVLITHFHSLCSWPQKQYGCLRLCNALPLDTLVISSWSEQKCAVRVRFRQISCMGIKLIIGFKLYVSLLSADLRLVRHHDTRNSEWS